MYEGEWIVGYVAEEVDVRFDSPVISIVLQGRMLKEKATVPAAHVAVGDKRTFANAERA